MILLNNNLGDVSEVESLLKNGINPNIKDAFGKHIVKVYETQLAFL